MVACVISVNHAVELVALFSVLPPKATQECLFDMIRAWSFYGLFPQYKCFAEQ